MESFLQDFCSYIKTEKGLSKNTIEAYNRDLNSFLSFLKKKSIIDPSHISTNHIIDFLDHLKKLDYAMTSISRHLISIKVFFKFLKREGYILKNISQYINSPKLWLVLPEVLSPLEVQKLLSEPNPNTLNGARDVAILEVLYASGLRVSELCQLKIYDIDDEFIRVLGKGRKERIIPIGKKAVQAVDHYLMFYRCNYDSEKLQYLFLTKKGKPIHRIQIWKMIKYYAKKCGITKNISPHTLRHSFATHLLDNKAELRVIQEMMGHANISSTDRYLHVSKSQIKEAFERFHPRNT